MILLHISKKFDEWNETYTIFVKKKKKPKRKKTIHISRLKDQFNLKKKIFKSFARLKNLRTIPQYIHNFFARFQSSFHTSPLLLPFLLIAIFASLTGLLPRRVLRQNTICFLRVRDEREAFASVRGEKKIFAGSLRLEEERERERSG